jgi:hypothetical protein
MWADQNPTEEDKPDSPLLRVLERDYEGQVQAPNRNRKHDGYAKNERDRPGAERQDEKQTEESHGKE